LGRCAQAVKIMNVATAPVHSHAAGGARRRPSSMPSTGVLLMRWLRWQGVISTPIEDHLNPKDPAGRVTRGDQGSVDGGERTFSSTLSMLQLASCHRISICT
jgi:hypothetical protein